MRLPHWRQPTAGRAVRPARLDEGGHTDWCGGGHRCGLGEHRAEPVSVDVPGIGRLMLVRVQGNDGRQWAEVRGSVVLPNDEVLARGRLLRLLGDLAEALRRHQ